MQVVMNSILADFNKEIQARRASKANKDIELQAFKVEVKAYKAMV